MYVVFTRYLMGFIHTKKQGVSPAFSVKSTMAQVLGDAFVNGAPYLSAISGSSNNASDGRELFSGS